MGCDVSSVLAALQATATESDDANALGGALVNALKGELPHASWVGIYWLHGRDLHLGPSVGPPTEHTRIPIGEGVCGTAVDRDEDRIVEDVTKEAKYLACSATVKSEMVVLIRSRGVVIGQIDLDAETIGAFSRDDYCVVRAAADGFAALVQAAPDTP